MSSSQKVKDWRKRTKARIVAAMGGKCAVCMYDKYPEAFDLHHLDPKAKRFQLSNIRANPKAWATIVQELRKCALVCARCHREVEAGYVTIPTKQYFNEDFADGSIFERMLHLKYELKICITCADIFQPTHSQQQRCSPLCGK